MGDVDDEDIDLLDFFSDEKADISPSSRHAGDGTSTNTGTAAAASASSSTSHSQAAQHPRRSTAPLIAKKAEQQHQRSGASFNSGASARHGPSSASSSPSNKPGQPALADFTEAYSGLRVHKRLLSTDDMRLRMKGRKVHRLAQLRTVPARALESQDQSDAWAVLGVLVSKSTRRQAANGGSYVIWTLSDLSQKKNDVSLFLFAEALASHWTVCEGTLLAVLSAKALPPKGNGAGGNDNDQRLAFSVDSPWQVQRFVTVALLSYCTVGLFVQYRVAAWAWFPR